MEHFQDREVTESGSGLEKNMDPDPVCPERLDPDPISDRTRNPAYEYEYIIP